jgi:predicted RNase H-like nuclease (RuvC/YqgF family)
LNAAGMSRRMATSVALLVVLGACAEPGPSERELDLEAKVLDLGARVSDLREQVAELEDENARLQAVNESLHAETEALLEEIDELEALLDCFAYEDADLCY